MFPPRDQSAVGNKKKDIQHRSDAILSRPPAYQAVKMDAGASSYQAF